MKIFFNGWFGGFLEKTNPGLNYTFFISLFEKVFDTKIELSNYKDSEILCEFDMLINSKSYVKKKKWKYTFLFSGESTLIQSKNNYDCVLWGERNNNNVVNVPLFIPYIYTNNFVSRLEKKENINRIPGKDVCVVISNPRGDIRNKFLEKLEKEFTIDYAGNYKNNIKLITDPYNTQNFIDFVSNYKFIVSMENSLEDTYITEKIIHGLLANTIPVYWGSKRIYDYINKERFLNLEDLNQTKDIIDRMKKIKENPEEYLKIINSDNFSEAKLSRNLEDISRDIRNLINSKKWRHIDQIYVINNEKFEPERYQRLNKMFFEDIKLSKDNIKFISNSYKHIITEEGMKKYIKKDLVTNIRSLPMKKAEISLFLNYRDILVDIIKNYKDGMFLIFESDIRFLDNINDINILFDYVYENKILWDMIHIGKGGEHEFWDTFCLDKYDTPYRKRRDFPKNNLKWKRGKEGKKYIEDITCEKSPIRLTRHLHTRCCDSLLYTFKGIEKLLSYFIKDQNYGAPMDYFFINILENDLTFKHYWSEPTFFIQGSNYNLENSTIQKDIN